MTRLSVFIKLHFVIQRERSDRGIHVQALISLWILRFALNDMLERIHITSPTVIARSKLKANNKAILSAFLETSISFITLPPLGITMP